MCYIYLLSIYMFYKYFTSFFSLIFLSALKFGSCININMRQQISHQFTLVLRILIVYMNCVFSQLNYIDRKSKSKDQIEWNCPHFYGNFGFSVIVLLGFVQAPWHHYGKPRALLCHIRRGRSEDLRHRAAAVYYGKWSHSVICCCPTGWAMGSNSQRRLDLHLKGKSMKRWSRLQTLKKEEYQRQ